MMESMFTNDQVDFEVLRKRAFNLRWATVSEDVLPFTAADSDFPAPSEVRLAICRYVQDGYFCYGPPEGLLGIREAIARRFSDNLGVPCCSETILPTNSAASAMFIAIRHFIHPGDEGLIFDPVDFLFESAIQVVGGSVRRLRLVEADRTLSRESIEEQITPKTKLLCVCNPSNPTGKVFTRDELETIADAAIRHKLWLLSDEVWSDIIFPPNHHVSLASLGSEVAERTVTVYGFSKGYALAGLRIGALVCTNSGMFQALFEASRVQSTSEGVAPIVQIAAQAALEHCSEWLESWNLHLRELRDIATARLSAIKGVHCPSPQGTFLLFPKLDYLGGDSDRIANHLLEVGRVSVVPGSSRWFGPAGQGHIRISFATSRAVLEEGLNRIEEALDRIC